MGSSVDSLGVLRGLPNTITVYPGVARGNLTAPPSKSYTHRALAASLLAARPSRILGPLVSEDTLASVRAVRALGGVVDMQEGRDGEQVWRVRPIPKESFRRAVIDAQESGTTLRFFTAIAALGRSPVTFEGMEGLARRPMAGLLTALISLGARLEGPPVGRGLPFTVTGPISGGVVQVESSMTSQYLSGLLLALPVAKGESDLIIDGKQVSTPYISATLAVLHYQGIRINGVGRGYCVDGGQVYAGRDNSIPGDASSAAYTLSLAALTGGDVTVTGMSEEWPQADLALLPVLERTGASVVRNRSTIRVTSPSTGRIDPFEADVSQFPDLAPLLAVIAAMARGRSLLSGGSQLAVKESDRRSGLIGLVRAMGAKAEESGDVITIVGPARARRLELTGLLDHRIFMSAVVAAAGLPSPSQLASATSIAKSYPRFLEDASRIGIRTESKRAFNKE